MIPPQKPLGETGVQLSPVALGTWGLSSAAYGTPPDDEAFAATVSRALDAGIQTIDVARLWGADRGLRVVGEVLQAREDASEVSIVARLGRRWPAQESPTDEAMAAKDPAEADPSGAVVDVPPNEHTPPRGTPTADFSAEALHEDAEASLEALGVSALDVALLHAPSSTDPDQWQTMVSALRTLRDEGLAHAVGAAVQTGAQARLAIDAGLRVLCVPVNPLHSAAAHEIAIRAPEVAIIARSPLVHGLMTASVPAGHEYPPDEHRRARWTEAALRTRIAHIRYLKALVGGVDQPSSMLDLGVRFAANATGVASVVVGARSTTHVDALTELLQGGLQPLRDEIRRSVDAQLALAGA